MPFKCTESNLGPNITCIDIHVIQKRAQIDILASNYIRLH